MSIANDRNITGKAVTDGVRIGIVSDGVPRQSGKNTTRVAVAWLGGRGPTRENREGLTIVDIQMVP